MLSLAILVIPFPFYAKEPLIKPTFAHDVTATVSRGGVMEIVLEAIPSYGREIIFRIQKQPLHGVLSNLHPTNGHTAVVAYAHDGSKFPLQDEFTFRAQAAGQSVSESYRCLISISPPPPYLVFDQSVLDFGGLILSGKTRKNITLINQGGTLAEGRLILPRGFSAPLGDRYRLCEGESNSVTIEFNPMEEREYVGEATVQTSVKKNTLHLHGQGIPRFELIRIASTEWRVTNLSDESLRISFTGGDGWILPRETSLAPKESRSYAFQQAEPNESLNDSLHPVQTNSIARISDGLSQRELELPPPMRFLPISIQTMTPVNLQSMLLGTTARITFSLINRSEFAKQVTWRAESSSGGGSDAMSVIDLKGGESREVSYDWKPTLAGDANLTITVAEGKSTNHELCWKSKVIITEGGSSKISTSTNTPANLKDQEDSHQPESPTVWKTQIPLLSGVEYTIRKTWFSQPVILLKWDDKHNSEERDVVEEQALLPVSSNATTLSLPHQFACQLTSIPVDVSRPSREGEKQVLELRSVPPGAHHFIITRRSKAWDIVAQAHLQINLHRVPSFWSRVKLPLGVIFISLLLLVLRDLRRRGHI
jgi:hypothetical protein